MCFFGHGAFGLITKKAWVPYFAVAGIQESSAWKLMPWIGSLDIAIAFLAFIWPCRALFVFATVWAAWTALLRPFAGQGWPEFFERAGNYGVPLAILLIVGLRASWFARLPDQWPELSLKTSQRVIMLLTLALATLLAGHATCALILKNPALVHHYDVFGPANSAAWMMSVGWFELVLAVAVLTRLPSVIVFACVWKIATEALFLTSGAQAPMFEVIERGGSYIIPLALAFLLLHRPTTDPLPNGAAVF